MINEKYMKISLAPIPYYWPRNIVYEFYELMQDLPIDIVYLGETVCAKRRAMKLQDWLSLARLMKNSGKEVVLSTLTLIEAASELNSVRRICHQQGYLIEANDMAAVQILSEKGETFVAGPFINIYNSRSLTLLQKLGLKRWVVPVELSRDTLNDILTDSTHNLDSTTLNIETELFCYGKLPLAWSARCFTARSQNLAKDECQFVCMDYPDGLQVVSQDQQTVFTLNGIQTQSGSTCDLSCDIAQIINTGVDIVRLSPQLKGMPAVIQKFKDALDNPLHDSTSDNTHCNGYWHNKPGFVNYR